ERPSEVPIQSAPSRVARRTVMMLEGSCCSRGGCQAALRTPSKRNRPRLVPSQRYPSGVWAIELIRPWMNPSRVLQAVCAYCLRSSAGFRANAEGHEATTHATITASTTTSRRRGRPCTARMLSVKNRASLELDAKSELNRTRTTDLIKRAEAAALSPG